MMRIFVHLDESISSQFFEKPPQKFVIPVDASVKNLPVSALRDRIHQQLSAFTRRDFTRSLDIRLHLLRNPAKPFAPDTNSFELLQDSIISQVLRDGDVILLCQSVSRYPVSVDQELHHDYQFYLNTLYRKNYDKIIAETGISSNSLPQMESGGDVDLVSSSSLLHELASNNVDICEMMREEEQIVEEIVEDDGPPEELPIRQNVDDGVDRALCSLPTPPKVTVYENHQETPTNNYLNEGELPSVETDHLTNLSLLIPETTRVPRLDAMLSMDQLNWLNQQAQSYMVDQDGQSETCVYHWNDELGNGSVQPDQPISAPSTVQENNFEVPRSVEPTRNTHSSETISTAAQEQEPVASSTVEPRLNHNLDLSQASSGKKRRIIRDLNGNKRRLKNQHIRFDEEEEPALDYGAPNPPLAQPEEVMTTQAVETNRSIETQHNAPPPTETAVEKSFPDISTLPEYKTLPIPEDQIVFEQLVMDPSTYTPTVSQVHAEITDYDPIKELVKVKILARKVPVSSSPPMKTGRRKKQRPRHVFAQSLSAETSEAVAEDEVEELEWKRIQRCHLVSTKFE